MANVVSLGGLFGLEELAVTKGLGPDEPLPPPPPPPPAFPIPIQSGVVDVGGVPFGAFELRSSLLWKSPHRTFQDWLREKRKRESESAHEAIEEVEPEEPSRGPAIIVVDGVAPGRVGEIAAGAIDAAAARVAERIAEQTAERTAERVLAAAAVPQAVTQPNPWSALLIAAGIVLAGAAIAWLIVSFRKRSPSSPRARKRRAAKTR